jgi:hypothetical protein
MILKAFLACVSFTFLTSATVFAQLTLEPKETLKHISGTLKGDTLKIDSSSAIKFFTVAGLTERMDYSGPSSNVKQAAYVLNIASYGLFSPEEFQKWLLEIKPQVFNKKWVLKQTPKLKFSVFWDKDWLAISTELKRFSDYGQDRHVLGEKGVMIREFADFQCGPCAAFSREEFPQIVSQFVNKGLARFSYRHLLLWESSLPLATLAECAKPRGLFWNVNQILFQFQDSMQAQLQKVGLADADIADCVQSADAKAIVQYDRDIAKSLGVAGTPSVFVGPYPLLYFDNLDMLRRLIKMATAKP